MFTPRYMDIYKLTPPTADPTCVLVEVPHAGLTIPTALEGIIYAPERATKRDADLYVDELFQNAPEVGATMLSACLSRYVVDLNRGPNDADRLTVDDYPRARRSRPRGVVWRMSTLGQPVIPAPLSRAEFERRLDLYYRPYHQALEDQIRKLRARFGKVVVIAAHSMPSHGPAARGGAVERRADIVPGTRGRTSADPRLIDFVDTHFRSSGLSVAHDTPYRGGWTTGHYGRPSHGQHVIQIEINRDLYLDERTHERKLSTWPALRASFQTLVRDLGHFARDLG